MRASVRTAFLSLALLAVVTTAASAKSNHGGYSNSSSCRGSSFSTCSSGGVGAGSTLIGVLNYWFNQWRNQNQWGISGNQGGTGGNTGGPVVFIGTPSEPPVVTPEPVTMTLLATGLAGMGGVGAFRRRKQQGLPS